MMIYAHCSCENGDFDKHGSVFHICKLHMYYLHLNSFHM